MFIDDTGNVHSGTSNHPQNRYAGITGVIFEWDYLKDKFDPGFKRLKERHFGTPAPVLHLRKMKKGMTPFECLTDSGKRAAWEKDAMHMYRKADYHVITVCVDKVGFYYRHPNWNGDIYDLLVGNAIERYFYFLRGKGIGDVMAEAVNADMDKRLKTLYRRFYDSGTDHIPGESLRSVLTSTEIKIEAKTADVFGLQIADLLASTCFSHCKKIYARGDDYDAFAMQVASVIEQRKFYRDYHGNPHRYGRVWRP